MSSPHAQRSTHYALRTTHFILLFVTSFALLFASNSVLFTAPAFAQDKYGLEATAGKAGLKSSKTLQERVGTAVAAVLSLVGIIFFLLILYGGLLWMTAQGAEDTVQKAKRVITGAVVGLLIVSMGYAITKFALDRLAKGGGGEGDAVSSGGSASDTAACEQACSDTYSQQAADCTDLEASFQTPCLDNAGKALDSCNASCS